MSPIRLDNGTTILVWCSECPGFRVHAPTRDRGYELGLAHQREAHPQDKTMREAMSAGLRRRR